MILPTADDLPPHDDSAERALLSCFLDDPKTAANLAGPVYNDDFYTEANRGIFRALTACISREPAPVGIMAVVPMVRDELVRVGATLALQALPDVAEVGTRAIDAENYAKIVRRLSASRSAMRAAYDVMVLARTDGDAALELGRQRFAESHEAFKSSQKDSEPISICAADLLVEPEDTRLAYWAGHALPGSVMLEVAAPKTGKTWINAAFIGALERGEGWLGGEPYPDGPITSLIASEEPPAVVKSWLRRFGVTKAHIVTRREASRLLSRPWKERVKWLETRAVEIGAKVLAVDTFRFWASLGSKEENDAGAVGAAMMPLLVAAGSSDLLVLVTHHTRKGEGGGSRTAGSAAFDGAVDTILDVENFSPNNPNDGRRKIKARGRFIDPENGYGDERVIRYVSPDADAPATFVLEGSIREARESEDRQRITEAVRSNPACTTPELIGLAHIRPQDAHAVLKRMVGFELLRTGTGKAKDPHRWVINPTHAAMTK